MAATSATDARMTDLSTREVRALNERLFVSETTPEVEGADDMVAVYSEGGHHYIVDRRTRSCTCPDHEYRCAAVEGLHCKHVHRALYRARQKPLPSWVDRSRVDPLLLDALEGNR